MTTTWPSVPAQCCEVNKQTTYTDIGHKYACVFGGSEWELLKHRQTCGSVSLDGRSVPIDGPRCLISAGALSHNGDDQ